MDGHETVTAKTAPRRWRSDRENGAFDLLLTDIRCPSWTHRAGTRRAARIFPT